MKLPGDSIGITDLLAYRECPRRMSFGMRRHVGPGEQSDIRVPEVEILGAVWARGYGSAIHEAIQASEEGHSDEDAIQVAWNRYGRYLEPGDVELLRDDLAVYHRRDFPGTRTLAAEDEFKVPLFKHEGRQIYFRFKIDRLYERLDAPGTFIHVDYKSSKWLKSEAEVHGDEQLWAYNFGVYEVFPECDQLLQIYDQLRGGQVPTRKSANQRQQMRDWLIKGITAVLEDEEWQDDGLLVPKHNDWCAWCPVLESCPVVKELSDYSLTRIAALAPQTKEGRRILLQIDPDRIGEYAAELEKVKQARGVLERFEESIKAIIRQMPEDRRLELGYELRTRTNNVFARQAAVALHDRLGDRFFELVKLTKSGLESNLAEDPELLEWALGLAEKQVGAASVVPRKAA